MMVGYIIPSDNVPMFISLLSWPLVLIPKHMWLSGDVERTRQTQPGWAGPGCPHERQKYQPWTRYALTVRGAVHSQRRKLHTLHWKRKIGGILSQQQPPQDCPCLVWRWTGKWYKCCCRAVLGWVSQSQSQSHTRSQSRYFQFCPARLTAQL